MKLRIANCKLQMGIALTAALVAVMIRPARAETIDRVLAVVNGDLIMLSDVTAARELGLVSAGTAVDPIRAVLSRLIDRTLELEEVDRYAPPEPSADALDREVQGVRARFPSSAAFDAVLARSGLGLQRLRETVRENLRIRAYLDLRFVAAQDRRQQLVEDWLTGLRRRAEIADLYSIKGVGSPFQNLQHLWQESKRAPDPFSGRRRGTARSAGDRSRRGSPWAR